MNVPFPHDIGLNQDQMARLYDIITGDIVSAKAIMLAQASLENNTLYQTIRPSFKSTVDCRRFVLHVLMTYKTKTQTVPLDEDEVLKMLETRRELRGHLEPLYEINRKLNGMGMGSLAVSVIPLQNTVESLRNILNAKFERGQIKA